MKHRIHLIGMIALAVVFTTACGNLIPSNMNFNIETSSELGPDTLSRIDQVNETLATGIEVGPETRDVIRELNQTIQQGVKAGFDEATLSRVDDLLRVAEDGIKIGLDADTLSSINGMVDTIDQMPGQWEVTATDVIQTLERSGGTLAGRMADEVKGVMREARLNMQQMTATAGTEFRCNVDFLGSKAGGTVQEFIGRSIVGRLKAILSGKSAVEEVPTPWVCQAIPEQVNLIPVGGRLVFNEGVITLTGYNYVDSNSPAAYVVDERGQKVESVPLFPYRTSPYQIQLNLQAIDFSTVPPRSRIVFKWPNVPETSGIAILLPTNNAPTAGFQFNPPTGPAPLTVAFTDTSSGDPVQWLWSFGDGASSNERNPTHTFTDARAFQVQLTASNVIGSSTVTQIVTVGELLAADFSFSPRQGDAPLIVQFEDHSSGAPTAWEWDFGDGERSDERNPEHIYSTPRPEGYTVSLRVTGAQGQATKTSPDRILVKEKLDADFHTNLVKGIAPLSVSFTDASKGSNITSWLWDFGDGTTSTERNPTHKFNNVNIYDISLTITNAEGVTDLEVKRGYITAFAILLPGRILRPLVPFDQTSVYYSTFTLGAGGDQLDTGIPYDKFVCGIVGMQALNGDIQEDDPGDILKAYMFPQNNPSLGKNTWWLTANFRTHNHNERWVLDTFCFDRKTEGAGFLYRDNFLGLEGGEAHLTGIKTSDYYFCGVVGQAALYGDIQEADVRPVIWQAYMDGSGPEWQIVVDFATHNTHERWNVNVLCLKRGSYLALERPTFVTQTYNLLAPPGHRYTTSINTSEYTCGIVGVSAERGDIQEDDAHDILRVHMIPDGPKWVIEVDFVTHNKEEDWRVDMLCISLASAKAGPPPP
jgi:PKD repeat protein